MEEVTFEQVMIMMTEQTVLQGGMAWERDLRVSRAWLGLAWLVAE